MVYLHILRVQPVLPHGNQFLIVFGRTDAEAETLIFWPPDRSTDPLEKALSWERPKAGREEENRG